MTSPIPHVLPGTPPSSAAQNALIDAVNGALDALDVLPPFVQKTTATTRTNIQDVPADPDLVLPLADGLWFVEAFITAIGDQDRDIRVAWLLSGGASQASTRHVNGPDQGMTNSAGNAMARLTAVSFSTQAGYGTTAGGAITIQERALVQVTGSGTVTIGWGQRTTGAGGITVNTNSFLTARRVG